MKTLRSPVRPKRAFAASGEFATEQHCADALRACEEAAARMKSASDELAACWSALRGSLNSGATGTELLRTRAWCNVLELRLKEHAHALEAARQGVDLVWREVVRSGRRRKYTGDAEVPPPNWTLFAQVMAGANFAAPHAAKS